MAEIKRFEDLKCWQEARVLVKHIFLVTTKGKLANEYTLANQLKRAGLSVMNNIAEGFSRYHKKDFIRFLDYSQSSSEEVKSLLYVIRDLDLMPENQVVGMQKQCEKIRKLTLGLLKHVKESLSEYGRDAVREEEQKYELSTKENWQFPEKLIDQSLAGTTQTPKHLNTQTPIVP